MFSLLEPPLLTRLKRSRSILIAGSGGGFDVYAGLPLALALRAMGKEVHLANLSFSHLYGLDSEAWLEQDVAEIRHDTRVNDPYFPEHALACWLESQGMPSTVYAFPQIGVLPLRAAYQALAERLAIDAVVLVDGGTDILMRGDEAGIGTPEEDMASLAAVSGLTGIPDRIALCLGFGVDSYHGVSHALVLENLAALDRAGAYLGALSVPRDSPEGAGYLDAVAHARAALPEHPSIVNGSIAAAIRGEFGDVQFTARTRNSELFVNPLMAMYFAVTVEGLAARNLYLDRIEETHLVRQISSAIEEFREALPKHRPPRAFPH